MKKRQEARETEYKAHKAKGLEEGTGTAVTFQQVVFAVGIVIFVIGALGLLLINC